MSRRILVIASLIFASSAYAQVSGQPFRLEAGRYSSECWFANVYRRENGELRRNSGYEKGTFTSVIQGDVAMEIVQAQSQDSTTRSVTKVITTPLGRGVFKQTSEIEVTDSFGRMSQTARMKYETNMRVQDAHSQNLMVRYGGENEKPASGESVWRKLNDGRVVVQSYISDKTTATQIAGGPPEEKIVANNLCIYTPQQ